MVVAAGTGHCTSENTVTPKASRSTTGAGTWAGAANVWRVVISTSLTTASADAGRAGMLMSIALEASEPMARVRRLTARNPRWRWSRSGAGVAVRRYRVGTANSLG